MITKNSRLEIGNGRVVSSNFKESESVIGRGALVHCNYIFEL